MWDKVRYHPTEIVRAPSPTVYCTKCTYKQKNLHPRIKSFYPHSVAAAYIVAADEDTKACAEFEALSTKANAHPGQLMHTKQRCYDSKVLGDNSSSASSLYIFDNANLPSTCDCLKVGAMDRALLQMCSIDDVLLDSTTTVVSKSQLCLKQISCRISVLSLAQSRSTCALVRNCVTGRRPLKAS